MIDDFRLKPALEALRALIVHAKGAAYGAKQTRLADLLNDVEMLPEYIASDIEQTEDFNVMLDGIAQMYPECRYIVETYNEVAAATP